MSSVQLSVVIITKNEAGHIADCLKSVPFADEWVVLDSVSSDATCAIAQGLGARVEASADWPGFGAQKNRALALARGEWVLSIDADERVSAELAREIVDALQRERIAPTGVAGFELSRRSRFCGQWMHHGDWYPDRVLRLFRRGNGRFSDDLVHERLLLDGPVQRLRGELLHETMPTLHDALDKMNRYSTGRAIDKLRGGANGGLGAALAHGAWAFVRCYLLKRGFLDGRLGFVLAVYVAEGTYYRYLKMATPISAES